MRAVLFILMLVLLPLRGWMGDAMATGMAVAELHAASSTISATHSGAEQAGKVWAKDGFDTKSTSMQAEPVAAMPSDCAGHAGADDSAAADADHCTPCSACGACHSASMSTAALDWAAAVHGSAPLAWPADAFFSADAAPHQKPPIS
jgi:hypothetical protein